MPKLNQEDGLSIKAKIYDLNEKAAKQALFGMVDILRYHPSVISKVFQMLIEDAALLTDHFKELEKRGQ